MDCTALHKETNEYVYPIHRNEVVFKLQYCGDDVPHITMHYRDYLGDNRSNTVQLMTFRTNDESPYFYCSIHSRRPLKYIKYYFEIRTKAMRFYLSRNGREQEIPINPFLFLGANGNDIFRTPDWAQGVLGYQIFPDRFSTAPNDDESSPSNSETFVPTRENFFGGTLNGITEKIPYLVELGVGLVYLTPIFLSSSNHKYDTENYFQIDPAFGTLGDFKKLVSKLHESNIKLVLDGVFNHIGYYSPIFQDVLKNGRTSEYYDWFYFDGPQVDAGQFNYEGVGYYKWMPKLNYQNKQLRNYIKSVGGYWMQYGIDGFRLDVADELDYTFLEDFRREMKQIDQDTLLIGETWKNGYDLLSGNQVDSVMNYRLADVLYDFIIRESSNISEIFRRIEEIYFDYPIQTHNILYNLLGSHDTERILTRCDGDIKKLELLVVLQMCLPGIPFVYYGDEIGMEGENDPDCRKAMQWSNPNQEVHEMYKRVLQLRIDNQVLRYGRFKHIDLNNGVYGLLRVFEEKELVLFINNSNEPKHIQYHSSRLNIDTNLSAYSYLIY